MVEWEFSYLDPSGNFRGSFTAEKMQKWYEQGYFESSLEIFIHRGRIADRCTLQWLCDNNGIDTPFIFSEPPHDALVHGGFIECPPGLTIEQDEISECCLENLISNSTQYAHPLNSVRANGELRVFKIQAERAKSWVLLSQESKELVYTMTQDSVVRQFQRLKTLLERADMAALDKRTTNNDLVGVICKFCCVKMSAASDVFKHLLSVRHINQLVTKQYSFAINAFDDYFERLEIQAKLNNSTTTKAVTKTTSVPSIQGKHGKGVKLFKLMQMISSESRQLTDEEFKSEMERLRNLAKRVDWSNFNKFYKDHVVEYRCTVCQKTLLSPTNVVEHHLSLYHCRTVRLKGIRVTAADIELWESQISVAIQ
ncbi:hypothetical protein KIN20_033980 [Parelaphostrongylus tenuis]|uniref:GYF domain-containing protein n=1 Tax=Parelaphostrongylus tenuis TaxID=148309 RepID=A0AAD5R8Y0_PARTN|nr:hypothetical protein KIN20_033980 [Parelaphostrongylus tenuis]